jgi:hypothetical protein
VFVQLRWPGGASQLKCDTLGANDQEERLVFRGTDCRRESRAARAVRPDQVVAVRLPVLHDLGAARRGGKAPGWREELPVVGA